MTTPPRQEARTAAEVLRLIDEATAAVTGQPYFEALVRNLAQAVGASCTFVTRFSDDLQTAHVRAIWVDDRLVDQYSYPLPGSPCELVLPGEVVCISDDVANRFPAEKDELDAIRAQSYLAIPLRALEGKVIGHLAVIDTSQRTWQESEIGILRIFAARATAELQRESFEQELRRMKDMAESASRAKSDFLATMSHEFRTPLNGVLGYAQLLLRDGSLDTQQRRSVESIKRCADNLLALVGDVLDLAKVEAGKLELHPQAFCLDALLDPVIELGRVDALRAGLSFVYETRTALPAWIEADERRIRQVLLNLLSNAVKYTDTGTVTFRVGWHADSVCGTLLDFEVEDTGIGIGPDEAERIFERFEQAAAPPTARAQGTGLGLTISRRLARAMGGNIRVVSRPGQGSRFVFSVPAIIAPGGEIPLPANGAVIVAYTGPRRRILIVDDQPDSRNVLKDLLGSLGFEIDEAADGESALGAVVRQRPDLILMDLVMPGLSGLETLARLPATSDRSKPRAIAMSASASDRTREECLQAGFVAFLPKPLHFDSLLDGIRDALGLEWITRPGASVPDAGGAATRLGGERAGRGALEEVLELARRGDVRAIQLAVDRYAGSVPASDPVLADLRRLTASFDMRGIRRLLGGDPGSLP